jgi:hypothetical protein
MELELFFTNHNLDYGERKKKKKKREEPLFGCVVLLKAHPEAILIISLQNVYGSDFLLYSFLISLITPERGYVRYPLQLSFAGESILLIINL